MTTTVKPPKLEKILPEAAGLTERQQAEIYERARYLTFVRDRQILPFIFIFVCTLVLLAAGCLIFIAFFELNPAVEILAIAGICILVLKGYYSFYMALLKPRLQTLVREKLPKTAASNN